MSTSNTPTLAEVLNAYIAAGAAVLRVALPGRVERFDAAAQVVDVKPLVHEYVEQEDGSDVQRPLPVVPNVPIQYASGGGLAITFPLQAGDTGLLVFCDRSIDAWQAVGGDTAPTDGRRHDLSDPVFIPGVHPNGTLPSITAGVIELGSLNGASQFVALANLVKARIDSLQAKVDSLIGKYNTHTHPYLNATTPATTSPGSAPETTLGALADVASATVKVKG